MSNYMRSYTSLEQSLGLSSPLLQPSRQYSFGSKNA